MCEYFAYIVTMLVCDVCMYMTLCACRHVHTNMHDYILNQINFFHENWNINIIIIMILCKTK